VVEECDVADGKPQDLDLGQFLVWRKGRQHATESAERGVERLDADSFPGRVRCPVALGRSPVTTSLLPATVARRHDPAHRRCGRANDRGRATR